MAIFIYSLRCPLTENAVRYVGKTEHPEQRLYAHIKRAQSGETKHRTAHWIRKVLAAGLSPTMEILLEVPHGTKWQDVERQYIADASKYGWILTNSTSGGDGASITDDPEATKRRLAAWRRTMALPEVRQKWEASQKAARETPESKRVRSDTIKSSWNDPEKRARYIAGMAKPEAKSNRSRATKTRYEDAEELARHTERMRAIWSTPERREQAKARSKAAHADPEMRARKLAAQIIAAKRPEVKAKLAAAMKEINARPEVKSKRSANSKARWQDPEYRAKLFDEPTRKKMSDKAKARWRDDPEKMAKQMAQPERRAKLSAAMARRNADPEFAAKARGPEARAKQGLAMKANWAMRKAAKAAAQQE